MISPEDGVWVTKTGEEIPVSERTDAHLDNIINFMGHYADQAESAAFSMLGTGWLGEQASYEWDRQTDQVQDEANRAREWMACLQNERQERRRQS